jgi:hypothetical protein
MLKKGDVDYVVKVKKPGGRVGGGRLQDVGPEGVVVF